MKLQVCVAYNQQGINLTQKKAHVFIIESDTTLDEKEIAERIYKEVPEVLIDSYSVGFSLPLIDVKVGDVLKMVHVIENKNFSQTLTKMVKVSQIEDGHLKMYGFDFKFNFEGKCLAGRKRKNLPYVVLPTKEEIESYKKEQIRRELLEEIGDVMEEIICQDYIPEHLQINELKTILSILKNEDQE